MLVYLDVSKTFCFPGITSDTISPGPIPKYPGQAPKGASSCGVTFGVGVWLRGAGLSMLSRGFSVCWLTRARAAAAFFIRVHSERETWVHVPCPTGSLTARVLGNDGSAPPQVSICLSPLIRPRQSSLGTACLVSHRLVSAEPCALAATRPLSHSLVFPHVRRKACLSR